MSKIIGITGLIASGKSTLTNYLKEKRYRVFDADQEVRELYSNINFLNRLKEIFPDVFIEGTLNKSILSKIIFSNSFEKKKLESLIHPIVEKKCNDFIESNINEMFIFLDIPLLFEVGWNKKCDEIILVIINKEIQKERYIKRGGKPELFENIIKNQGNIIDKISKSTYILENNNTIKCFYSEIDKIIKTLSKNF